ncbi:unnamed protein product [Prorocentrum cordatum]|uniref:Carbamoyl-phosphate synthetase large subunit oligomerisation domain-containing protein n=1 Tax=Prorocentrum cordatum TaxID=2364126 RepID=A0ABN9UZ02_9DINO|nr:unnamed protein product [Polarella glacialis]
MVDEACKGFDSERFDLELAHRGEEARGAPCTTCRRDFEHVATAQVRRSGARADNVAAAAAHWKSALVPEVRAVLPPGYSGPLQRGMVKAPGHADWAVCDDIDRGFPMAGPMPVPMFFGSARVGQLPSGLDVAEALQHAFQGRDHALKELMNRPSQQRGTHDSLPRTQEDVQYRGATMYNVRPIVNSTAGGLNPAAADIEAMRGGHKKACRQWPVRPHERNLVDALDLDLGQSGFGSVALFGRAGSWTEDLGRGLRLRRAILTMPLQYCQDQDCMRAEVRDRVGRRPLVDASGGALGAALPSSRGRGCFLADEGVRGRSPAALLFGDKGADGRRVARAGGPLNGVSALAELAQSARPTPSRVWAIAKAFELGMGVEKIHALTRIDRWFLSKLLHIHTVKHALQATDLSGLAASPQLLLEAKRCGFADRQIAPLLRFQDGAGAHGKWDYSGAAAGLALAAAALLAAQLCGWRRWWSLPAPARDAPEAPPEGGAARGGAGRVGTGRGGEGGARTPPSSPARAGSAAAAPSARAGSAAAAPPAAAAASEVQGQLKTSDDVQWLEGGAGSPGTGGSRQPRAASDQQAIEKDQQVLVDVKSIGRTSSRQLKQSSVLAAGRGTENAIDYIRALNRQIKSALSNLAECESWAIARDSDRNGLEARRGLRRMFDALTRGPGQAELHCHKGKGVYTFDLKINAQEDIDAVPATTVSSTFFRRRDDHWHARSKLQLQAFPRRRWYGGRCRGGRAPSAAKGGPGGAGGVALAQVVHWAAGLRRADAARLPELLAWVGRLLEEPSPSDDGALAACLSAVPQEVASSLCRVRHTKLAPDRSSTRVSVGAAFWGSSSLAPGNELAGRAVELASRACDREPAKSLDVLNVVFKDPRWRGEHAAPAVVELAVRELRRAVGELPGQRAAAQRSARLLHFLAEESRSRALVASGGGPELVFEVLDQHGGDPGVALGCVGCLLCLAAEGLDLQKAVGAALGCMRQHPTNGDSEEAGATSAPADHLQRGWEDFWDAHRQPPQIVQAGIDRPPSSPSWPRRAPRVVWGSLSTSNLRCGTPQGRRRRRPQGVEAARDHSVGLLRPAGATLGAR